MIDELHESVKRLEKSVHDSRKIVSDKNAKELVSKVNVASRYIWCESSACACVGCANGSGGLSKAGVSKSQWSDVVICELRNKLSRAIRFMEDEYKSIKADKVLEELCE